MAITNYFAATSGRTYYVKPTPIVTSPSWGADVVLAVETGTTGVFSVSGLTHGTGYFIYERDGASPAATDDIEGEISALTVASSSSVITQVNPQTISGLEVITLSDMVNALLDRTMAPAGDARTIRLLTSAIQQAIRDLPKRNKWHYYKQTLRFRATASIAPTVAYTAANRTMVITSNDTWPTDAVSGEIMLGYTPYDIEQRVDNSTIVLKAGTAYNSDYTGEVRWQRSRYTFDRIFVKVDYLINLETRLPIMYLDTATFYERSRLIRFAGIPSLYTFRGSDSPGKTDIVLSPPASTQYVFESLVQVAPRIPKVYQMTAKDGATVSGSKTFISNSSKFNTECVGAVLRIYDSANDIPYGVPSFSTFIDAVPSSSTLTLATPAPTTSSNAVFVVSSYLDIEPGLMNTMVENLAYANYCQNHDHKGLATAMAISQKTLLEAIAADSKLNHTTTRDFGWQLAWARPHEYAQVITG